MEFVAADARVGRDDVIRVRGCFVDDIPKPAGSISPVGGNRGVGNEAGRKALDWLERQLSHPLDARGRSGRLIDSYEDDDRRGWTYDAALAAVTFTAWGQIDTGANC
jgi:hypothetical protein